MGAYLSSTSASTFDTDIANRRAESQPYSQIRWHARTVLALGVISWIRNLRVLGTQYEASFQGCLLLQWQHFAQWVSSDISPPRAMHLYQHNRYYKALSTCQPQCTIGCNSKVCNLALCVPETVNLLSAGPFHSGREGSHFLAALIENVPLCSGGNWFPLCRVISLLLMRKIGAGQVGAMGQRENEVVYRRDLISDL